MQAGGRRFDPDRLHTLKAIELFPPASSVVVSFLTSPRGFYFYAFVLLAGILAFGLTLTLRTVSQQLELARMQSNFVSTVSHEFKSPLTAIRQLAEMLQSDRVPLFPGARSNGVQEVGGSNRAP